MTNQLKALQMSFTIHALIFLVVLGVSHSIMPVNRPIVIDLSIESSQQSEVRSQKSEVREKKSEIRKIEQKNEPQIADTHPSPISDSQIPAPPTQSHAEVSAKSEGRVLTASHRTDSSPGDKTGSDASGSSEEKAKIKYLKEHFAYIRDVILKNLAYPHMARKMGWEGKVTVSFVVRESGHVENIKIIESSGVGILDKNAVETIKRVLPFPKPPVKAELIMPIAYKLE